MPLGYTIVSRRKHWDIDHLWRYSPRPSRIIANYWRAHVWGCPVFVLDPKLQDGKKLPTFNRRARIGQFVGFSDEHLLLVAKVRNLSTNFISPQFHVIFDDKFTTIQNNTKLEDTSLESIFTDLFDKCRDYYGEEPLESDSGAIR